MSVRRTKIVATLGPASNSPEMLEQLILAGLDVARLNFSHGTPDEHKARAKLVRDIAAKHGRFVALLGDLQGPKIRIAKFANKKIELKIGDQFTFSTSHPLTEGNQQVVGIDYPDLVKDCGVGDELLLDDGRVVMRVDTATDDALHCTVLIGGPLSDHKGINRRGGGLTAPALTEKDKADIKLAAEMQVDYLAVSFPRDAADMEYARQLRDEAGGTAWLVAKIERAEAVADDETLDGLIKASDAVMVARGDLGVEIGDAELVGIQKKIILNLPKTRDDVEDLPSAPLLGHRVAVLENHELARQALQHQLEDCGLEVTPFNSLESLTNGITSAHQTDQAIDLAVLGVTANDIPPERLNQTRTNRGRVPHQPRAMAGPR